MSVQLVDAAQEIYDPLDVIEAFADDSDVVVQRADAQELHLTLNGLWGETTIWFAWRPDYSTLQVGAPLDIEVGKDARGPLAELLVLINESLWLGHFDLWAEDGAIVYRHALVLPEGIELDSEQAQLLIQGALEAHERFKPAFDFLVNDGKSAREAFDACLFETAGNA